MASSSQAERSTRVGFLGLGNMGRFMAINLGNALAQRGHPKLKVWNRTRSKADEVVSEAGGSIEAADSITEVAETCNIIFTSLANDEAVKEVYTDIFRTLQRDQGVLLVECSTLYPDMIRTLQEDTLKTGNEFVAALPFGRSNVAQRAQLVFALGGHSSHVKRAQELIIPAMGRHAMDLGQDASKASTFKLLGNSIILSTIEMLGETMTLADKVGIGADRVSEWISVFYTAPSAVEYADKMAHQKFETKGGFSLTGGLKDAKHIENLGKEHGCRLHIVEQARKHLEHTIELNAGQENKDWSALVAAQRVESGLEPFAAQK